MKDGNNLSIVALIVILSLALLTGSGAGQVSAGPAAPQTSVEPAPAVVVALPWDDASVRIPPPARSETRDQTVPRATFEINYLPSGALDGQGAACAAWSPPAQAAFSYAATIWAASINSSVPIKIDACWAALSASGILGYSWSNLVGLTRFGATYWHSYALGDALLGYDYDDSRADIHITYNNRFTWYFGMDGNTPIGQYDFVTVVLHEIAHGLNFAGTARYGTNCSTDGASGCWGYAAGVPQVTYPGIYDRFVENGSRQALTNTNLFPNPSAALGTQLTSSNLYFNGLNASAANAGNPVKLYAPASWAQGSSYSHLDYNTFRSTVHRLMVYAIPSAASIHDPGNVTMGVLKDLGWILSPVEPVAPEVTVSASDGDLMLAWPTAEGMTYQVWRSARPYFAPDELDAVDAGATCTHDAGMMSCTVAGAVGNPDANHYYVVRASDTSGQVADSTATGAFGFRLALP